MFELLLKSQPYLMPNTHGVVDWPVLSLTVQLVAATTPGRWASRARAKSPIERRAVRAAARPAMRPSILWP